MKRINKHIPFAPRVFARRFGVPRSREAKKAHNKNPKNGGVSTRSSAQQQQQLTYSTYSISYFKVFVYTLFPPAAFLLAMLLIPFPPKVAKAVISMCDSFLFLQPHPTVPLSLFWCVVTLSAVTFLLHMDNLTLLHAKYRGFGHEPGTPMEDRDRALIKLLAEERNCWICGCNLVLWVGVHRYRSLLKRYYRSEDQKSAILIEKQRVLALFSQSQMDINASRNYNGIHSGGGDIEVEEEEHVLVEEEDVQNKKTD